MQTLIPAKDCQTAVCAVSFGPDVAIYNLQDGGFFNETALTFIVDCPPGYACPPGTFPKTVVYPPGTFVLPDPNVTPGFPIYLSLTGCQSTVSLYLDADSTAAEIAAAAQDLISQVAQQQAECDSVVPPNPTPNPNPGALNQQVFTAVSCAEGTTLTYFGILPPYITLDVANNRVVMAAGIVGGATQAEANATAQAFVNNWANTALQNDTLQCVAESGCSMGTPTWSEPVINESGATAEMTVAANIMSGSAEDSGGVEGTSASATTAGVVSYAGPEIDCCVLVTTSDKVGVANWTITIYYDFGGPFEALLLNINGSSYVASNPFTIPETIGAVDITINLQISASAGEDPWPGGSVDFYGTIGGCP